MSEKKAVIKEVFVSIVTLPKLDYLELGSDEFTRFKSTYTEHKEYLNDKEVINSYYNDAGKSVAFSRVYQISIGFVYEDTVRVKILTGEEKNILLQFHESLKVDFKDAKLYGYNNKFIFDILTFRARCHKISKELEAPQFKDIKNQPWKQDKSICLMDETVNNYRGKISFLNALHGANIDYSDIIPSENLFDLYKANKSSAIEQSGACYVKGLVNLKRFLDAKNPIKNLNYVVVSTEKPLEKEISLIDHITSSGHITPEYLDLILKEVEDKNLDKESVYDTLNAALSKEASYNTVPMEIREEIREHLGLKSLEQIGKEKKRQKEEQKEEQDRKNKKAELEKYNKILLVVEKGNLGKTESDALIEIYSKSSNEIKKEVLSLTEEFLREKNKLKQVRTSKALIYLKEKL